MIVCRSTAMVGALLVFAPGCTLFVGADSYSFGEDASAADGGPDAGAMDARADAERDGGEDCSTPADCPDRPRAVMDCRVGECVISGCETGWGDCDGLVATGCEIDLDTDGDNCGGCGDSCALDNAEASCVGGLCQLDSCVSGWGDCDTDAATGCEASLRTDTHCGVCGGACLADRPLCDTSMGAPVCVESCSGTATLCGTSCADLDTDPTRCGGCDTVCADVPFATPTCSSGACGFSCLSGRADCGAGPGCETNTMTSLAHCGGCDMPCTAADGTAECAMGACRVAACDGAFLDCNTSAADGCETDGDTSPLHCGGCGRACPAGCVGGVCDPIVDIALGFAVSCAVRASGQVFCWGTNDRGQLGQGDTVPRALPTRVLGVGGVGFLDAVDVSVVGESPTQSTVCAVLRDGTLACWGNNTYGTCGSDSGQSPVLLPRAVASTDAALVDGRRFVGVSTSFETGCAVDSVGDVWCWGRNSAGELGVPVVAPGLRPSAERVVFPGSPTLAEVQVTFRYACARTTTGRVLCWGTNWGGNLGDGTAVSRHTPMPTTPSIDDAVQVRLGAQHACALRSDRRVWCWGVGTDGQLGRGTSASSLVPVEATQLGTDVSSLNVGHWFSMATTGSGTYLAVGRDRSGELAQGSTAASRLTAVSPMGVAPGARLHNGTASVCAVLGASATCWGDDRYGQLAIDEGLLRATPIDVALAGVSAITLGESAGCLRAAGSTFCFGRGVNGQLGNGSFDPTATPTRTTIPTIDRPTAGVYYACGIAGGEAYCWGAGGNGRLGDGSSSGGGATPRLVALPGSETRVSASGLGHTCAIQAPGSVYCWGNNATGAVGRGTFGGDLPMPGPPVMGISDAVELTSGAAFTCALRASREVACWGAGNLGQIGDAMLMNRSAATAVAFLSNVITVAAGANHACAIVGSSPAATAGSVFCWGDNSAGAVGNPLSVGAHSTPFAVGSGAGITDAIALGTGAAHSCALRSTGEILCWGNNDTMQLGDGTRTTRTSPVVSHTVVGASGLSTGSTSVRTQCAYRADGSAVCWGYGPEGMTGSGEPINVATPAPMLSFGGTL